MIVNNLLLLSHHPSADFVSVDIWASVHRPHRSTWTQLLSKKLYVILIIVHTFLIYYSSHIFTFFTWYVNIYVFLSVVVVAKRNDANAVTLTCGTKSSGEVVWKFDGDELDDFEDNRDLRKIGTNLSVTEVDTPMLGEYSCWSGGEMISSTYLLLKAEYEEELGKMLLWNKRFFLLPVHINDRNHKFRNLS